jgi:predicted NBD/HSP70 family sugar kinase
VKPVHPKHAKKVVARTAIPQTVRLVNRHLLLELIRLHQPISRAQLSTATGMVRSNVSSIVDELIAGRLVTERNAVPNGRGRVPLLLELNDNGNPLFAVNLRSTKTTVALATLSGVVRDQCIVESCPRPKEFVSGLKAAMNTLAVRNGVRLKQIRNVGVSVPGLAAFETGEIVSLPFFPDYAGYPLAREIEQVTGISASVENDCNLAAMALLWHGESGDDFLSNFVLVDAGDVGLGAGIVMNRELYRGHDRTFAAELGHMVIDPAGPRCRCGRNGCLELYATDQATWQRHTGTDFFDAAGFEGLVATAETGDPTAIQAFRLTEEYLANAIGNIVCALNPKVVILSGQITRVPGSISRIDRSLRQSIFGTDLRASPLKSDDLFLQGAICLASEKLFQRPRFAAYA